MGKKCDILSFQYHCAVNGPFQHTLMADKFSEQHSMEGKKKTLLEEWTSKCANI